MFFSEFLETCTIRWVLICEGGVGIDKRNAENAFFEFFLREVSTAPPPGSPHIPRRWRPKHHSAPGRPAHHGQQGRPCQMQGRPRHAPTHTRPDAGHAAPLCTRYQTSHAEQTETAAGAGGRAVCPIGHAQTDKKIKRINTSLCCTCNLTKT